MKKYNLGTSIVYPFAAFVVILLMLPSLALAHATPVSYEPEAVSILEIAPERVSIRFSERVEPAASGIAVYGPDGKSVTTGEAVPDAEDARRFSVQIDANSEGTYTASWQVVSADDGHFTKGAFSFSVGKVTGVALGSNSIQIQHITTIPQAVTIGVELIGQAILGAILVVFAFLWRPLRKKVANIMPADESLVFRRFTILMYVGVALVILGVVLFIVLKTFDLQQLRPSDFAGTLQTFLGTVDGSWASGRAILALVLLAVFLYFRRGIFSAERLTKAEAAMFALFCAVMLSRARVSHAAASHFLPFVSVFINAAQLLFKELWVGGLIVFSLVVMPILVRAKNVANFAIFSVSFSRLMSVAFGAVGISGAYIVWLHLKDPSNIFITEWGERLILLSVIGGALLFIRLYHMFIADRAAMAIATGSSAAREKQIVSWLRVTIPFEMLIGVALLFMTAFIIITTPPYIAERFNFLRSTESQGARIEFSVHPYEPARFLIEVTDIQTGAEMELDDIIVTLANSELGIGPIVAETEKRFPGGYVLAMDSFSPVGNWRVDVSARRQGTYDAVATLDVNYPDEINATRVNPDARGVGWFEILMLLAACGMGGASYWLFRFSSGLHAKHINEDADNNDRSFGAPLGLERVWSISTAGFVLFIFGIWYFSAVLIQTDFERLCRRNGHFWLQSVPAKDGVANSSDTVTGCFLDVGLYHFADRREYEYFFRQREILAELSAVPSVPRAGEPAELMLALSEIQFGKKIGPARDIGIYHDRILHMLIVGEDFETFAHIHAEDLGPITDEMKREAVFPLRYAFPKAGRYGLAVSFVVGGREKLKVFYVTVAGDNPMQKVAGIEAETTQTKVFNGYKVTLSVPGTIKAKEKIKLKYFIEKNGEPVTDLEPYLSAAMHIGIVRSDLASFTHTHGEALLPGSVWFQQLLGKYFKYHIHFAPDKFGPRIITQPWTTVFPTVGTFKLFGEFRHEGKTIVTDFTVRVSE